MDEVELVTMSGDVFQRGALNEFVRVSRLWLNVHADDIKQTAGGVAFGRATLTAEQVEKFVFQAFSAASTRISFCSACSIRSRNL